MIKRILIYTAAFIGAVLFFRYIPLIVGKYTERLLSMDKDIPVGYWSIGMVTMILVFVLVVLVGSVIEKIKNGLHR